MPPSSLAPMVSTLLVVAHAATATAQLTAGSVLDRTPNLVNTWLADPATVQFNFLHRFTESGAPEHQISNSPTFLVAAGLPRRTTAGFAYATTSDVVPGRPNEWEFFGRVMPFGHRGRVADVSLHVGYNLGAASTDAELALARRVGAVRLLAAGRTFSNAFRAGERRSAVAGGVNLRLRRFLALGGDVGTMLDRRADERLAWSAGLQIGIPTTPHSFSIHASNVTTATLQGVSSGTPRTRYGFEYTVPITLARYIPALRPAPSVPTVAASAAASAAGAPAGDTVRVAIRQLAYEPVRIEVTAGTTVEWTNDAPLQHTVTADDGSFDSGVIDIGKRWAHTFARSGTYAVHCEPHPFMKAVVVVR